MTIKATYQRKSPTAYGREHEAANWNDRSWHWEPQMDPLSASVLRNKTHDREGYYER